MTELGFLQGGPAPPFALPPSDGELKKRIDTLAAYAARNGISFVQMMSERQGGNPDFAFLHGGAGHEYYAWALYCGLNGQDPSKPPPGQQQGASAAPNAAQAPAAGAQAQGAAAAAAAAAAGATQAPAAPAPATAAAPAQQGTAAALQGLPPEVSSGWQQVLLMLTGSRDSIRNSQQWFMACAPYAAGMAEMMVQHVLAGADYQKQLHIVYLANDILFKALSMRPAGSGADADAIAQAFKPRLGRMLRATYVGGGQTAEVQQNLTRVVNFWAERGVYDRLTVEHFTMELMGIPLPGGAATSAPASSAAAPAGGAPAAAGAAAPGAGSWDVAAAARAAAAAIAQKVGAAAGAPAAPATSAAFQGQQQQQQWGVSPAAPPPYGAQPQPAGFPGQMAYPAAVGALPGPPPPSSYYAPGTLPQQPPAGQHPQQPFGFYAMPPYPGQPGIPPPGYFPPAPGQYPGQPGFPPPHGAPPGPFPPGQPPVGQPPPSAPEPEPEQGFDPCSFPPGLIPKLVEEKLKTDPPYSPLSILDIEEAGVPPPPKMDAYLKSRVDKFYAQLADYRPGMLYSDIEVDAPRSKHFSDRPAPGEPPAGGPLPPPGPELPHAGLGLATGPAMMMQPVDDGSFGGPGLGSGNTGLGYHSARREQRQAAADASAAAGAGGAPVGDAGYVPSSVDVFSSYRQVRSAGYHQMIINNAAKRWVPKGS